MRIIRHLLPSAWLCVFLVVFAGAGLRAGAQTTAASEWTWMGGSNMLPSCPSQENCGQFGWFGTLQTPDAGNVPEGRSDAVSWTDRNGNLWLFGGIGVQGSLNDLWEFNPSTAEWAWIAGNSTVAYNPLVGSGQPGVYGTLGTPASGNAPGSRFDPVGWTDSVGNLWLFGGYGFDANGAVDYLNDLWKFNTSTNEWTWMGGDNTLSCLAINECYIRPGVYGTLGTAAPGNTPGGRGEAAEWTDKNGILWLYGGLGADSRGIQCYLDDLWEFNPSTNQWAWMNGANDCPGFNAGFPGSYGSVGVLSASNYPSGLALPVSWTDSSGDLWLFGGFGVDTSAVGYYLNDMWEFSPSINEWEFTSTYSEDGPTGSAFGTYGTLGVWSPTNIPGGREAPASWTDSDGNFWLLGGVGTARASLSLTGTLNDLWEFKPSINEWAWMGGSNTGSCLGLIAGICSLWGQRGVYGALGTPASGNAPGARYTGVTWTDSSGNLWLFGGWGYGAQGNGGYLNDLWQYGLTGPPSVRPASPTATPTLSLSAGTYTSQQTLTISDPTPGATIYYTTDGTVPTSMSAVYQGQIVVSSSETFNAIALSSGFSISGGASATYTISLPAATPAFSVAAGIYATNQSVAISDATNGATIYYTTDGTTPTTSSTVYAGPIPVVSTESIEAIATASGYSTSAVAMATYTIPQSFTLSMNPTSMTVTAGASGTSTVTVQDEGGFNGNVSFGCSGLPAGAGCSFSQLTVPTAAGVSNTTLTVTTTAANATLHHSFSPVFPEAALAVAFCCFGLRKRPRLQILLLLAVSAGGLGLLNGCGGVGSGGDGGGGGSQPVTSTVTVTATSGSLQQTTTFTLTVN